MSSINPLEALKTTILDLIGVLKDHMLTEYEEQGDLVLVEFFFQRMDHEKIMDHVVTHVLPFSTKIRKRDQTFFLNNKGIFAGLPENRIDHYSDVIVNSSRLSREDRDEIWEYFDTIVALAEKYRKQK